MSPLALFLVLLGLAFLGRFVVRNRDGLRLGLLPSGLEYAVVGFALGPQVFDIIGPETLHALEPIAHFAMGLFAFLVGLEVGGPSPRNRGILSLTVGAGIAGAAMTVVIVGGIVGMVVLFEVGPINSPAALVMAAGAGIVCAETARHGHRHLGPKKGPLGPVASRIVGFAQADDTVPILASALVFPLAPMPASPLSLGPIGWFVATILLGVVLGAMMAAHLDRELRVAHTWGATLGMSALGVGLAVRLGVSPLGALFVMGAVAARFSSHGAALRDLLRPLERDVLLPLFLLAGAHIDLRLLGPLPAIVLVAVGVRIAVKLVVGLALGAGTRAGLAMGLAILPSGALSLVLGMAFALRWPGFVGQTILVTAALSCLVGEVAGPLGLQRVLARTGESRPPKPIDPEAAS